MMATSRPGSTTPAAGHRDVRVDVGDGDRDPARQAHPAGRFGGQIAGAAAERRELADSFDATRSAKPGLSAPR